MLDDLGLEPASQQLVEEFRKHTGIEVSMEVRLDESEARIHPDVVLTAYRLLQESLTNTSRHSGAGTVSISLLRTEKEILLSVFDDGKGFDPRETSGDRGSGITGMHERANLVGGTVEIRTAPGQGTRVVFRASMEQQPPRTEVEQ